MSAFFSSPALEVIRASTALAHEALERSLEVARPDADDGAYVRYLEAVLGWLEPLESPLWSAGWPEPVSSSARRGKVLWVEADLRARGHSDRQLAALPRQCALPPLSTLAQRFGVAYVVEGAQLGGQVLLRRLAPRLRPLPMRWLEGYGAEVGAHWQSFLAALATSLRDRGDAQIAADSARVTFELVHRWFALRGVA